ncbi:hypothetical protein Tco_0662515 [Tanacetum coccineum]
MVAQRFDSSGCQIEGGLSMMMVNGSDVMVDLLLDMLVMHFDPQQQRTTLQATKILHNADCAFIINVDFGIHEIETIVQHLISDPQYCPQQLIFSFLLLEVATIVVFLALP